MISGGLRRSQLGTTGGHGIGWVSGRGSLPRPARRRSGGAHRPPTLLPATPPSSRAPVTTPVLQHTARPPGRDVEVQKLSMVKFRRAWIRCQLILLPSWRSKIPISQTFLYSSMKTMPCFTAFIKKLFWTVLECMAVFKALQVEDHAHLSRNTQ